MAADYFFAMIPPLACRQIVAFAPHNVLETRRFDKSGGFETEPMSTLRSTMRRVSTEQN